MSCLAHAPTKARKGIREQEVGYLPLRGMAALLNPRSGPGLEAGFGGQGEGVKVDQEGVTVKKAGRVFRIIGMSAACIGLALVAGAIAAFMSAGNADPLDDMGDAFAITFAVVLLLEAAVLSLFLRR